MGDMETSDAEQDTIGVPQTKHSTRTKMSPQSQKIKQKSNRKAQMNRQKGRMQWEKDQFVRLPRSADAIAGTEDSALIGGNFTLYAEVCLGIKEYHIKHAVPPPTSTSK